MKAGTRKLRDTHLGPSRAVEFHVRNTLFLGFFVLLLLVAALGYRSVKNLELLEKDSVRVDETEERHLRIVLDISETAGKVSAESRNVAGTPANELLQFPSKQQLKGYKREMEAEVDQGRMSSLVNTEQWKQFEASYRDFW